MFCRKCGNELREGDQFCSRCGEPVEIINVIETGEVVLPRKKATFKEGIAALFNKTFTFKGTSSRSEFNFGLLFLYLMGILVTWIVLVPVFNDMPITGDTLELTNYILEQLDTTDLTSPYSIATIAISLIYGIFLAAPVYRRTLDIYGDKSRATTFCIIFCVGQFLNSGLIPIVLGETLYNVLSPMFLVASIAAFIVEILCIFKKGMNQR